MCTRSNSQPLLFCSEALLPFLAKFFLLSVNVHWQLDKVLALQNPWQEVQQLPVQISDRFSSHTTLFSAALTVIARPNPLLQQFISV